MNSESPSPEIPTKRQISEGAEIMEGKRRRRKPVNYFVTADSDEESDASDGDENPESDPDWNEGESEGETESESDSGNEEIEDGEDDEEVDEGDESDERHERKMKWIILKHFFLFCHH